jgi:steroid delta-isomerase-like uncharacterized protein
MNEMKPIEIQERWGKAAASGEFDVFDEIIAATVVDHDPAPGQAPGPAGYKAFFAQMRTAFPDLKITAEHAVASDKELAVAYTIEGTHQGPFMGVAATGKHVKARGMQIARFEDGKAVERWGSSDELGILKQIGATALPRN